MHKEKWYENRRVRLIIFIPVLIILVKVWLSMVDGRLDHDMHHLSDQVGIGYIVVIFIIGWYATIIIHELGHYVFGRLAGYQLIACGIGNVMFINENGKLIRKRLKMAGLAGYCQMLPSENTSISQFSWYLAGGVLFNFLTGLTCMGLVMAVAMQPQILLVASILYYFGFAIGFISLLPGRHKGQPNDGYYLLKLRKGQLAVDVYRHINLISAANISGVRFKDMSPEWFQFDPNANFNDPAVCISAFCAGSYYGEKGDTAKEHQIYDHLLQHGTELSYSQEYEIKCDLLFRELVGSCRKEVVTKFYTKELQKYINMTKSYPFRKYLMYAYFMLYETNPKEAEKQLTDFEKIAKSYPFTSSIESCREQIKIVQERVHERDISQSLPQEAV